MPREPSTQRPDEEPIVPTILVVDDDADVANVISDMLTTRGYMVLTEIGRAHV